jgi:hypothetical protein
MANKEQMVIICPNGLVKFYNIYGSRNMEHPNGFYNSSDLDFYKENYKVIIQ